MFCRETQARLIAVQGLLALVESASLDSGNMYLSQSSSSQAAHKSDGG
jgi:hypothetical protein